MRYYYKDVNGNKCSLRTPIQQKDYFIEDGTEIIHNEFTNEDEEVTKYKKVDFYTEITEEEFNARPAIPQEVLERQEKQRIIVQKKKLLMKYREDVEQVDLFGMQRDDYEEKKLLCKNLVLELRELEKTETAEEVKQDDEVKDEDVFHGTAVL